jgi:hypothetical protein
MPCSATDAVATDTSNTPYLIDLCLHAGLGSLLQTAEMAWQQDDDLFSSSNHVLAAALEVHARIVNAGGALHGVLLRPPLP